MQADLVMIRSAVERTLRGDTNAYAIIVQTYMQKLYVRALYLLSDHQTAQDLVQETLIDAYLHLADLREIEKIEGWLTRILKNKSFRYLSRQKPHIPDEIPESLPDPDSPEALVLSEEGARLLEEQIARLSPALREAAFLYFREGMRIGRIAQITGTPLGTIKRRIHDARIKLKQEIHMQENNKTLPDDFAARLTEKIGELKTYLESPARDGERFAHAQRELKTLISALPDADARAYELERTEIALKFDFKQYSDEALDTFRKYGDSYKASMLFLDRCWEHGWDAAGKQRKLAYTLDTILPALRAFPEKEERHLAIGIHLFWLAHYVDKTTPEGIDQARKYLHEALGELTQYTLVDAAYANTLSALKGLEELERDYGMREIDVTGETWLVEENNLYYYNQPGCNYLSQGDLYRYGNPIFYYAGFIGDRRFFPVTREITAGTEEEMIDRSGKPAGVRRVISTCETVTTPCGVFEGCLHIEKVDADGDRSDTWYKEGVGIVRSCIDSPLGEKVLCAYEIKGGEGYLPIALGNRWCYESPIRPDYMIERNEYVIEQVGKHAGGSDAVSLSALNVTALAPDWEQRTDDPTLLISSASALCEEKRYDEACEKLRSIIMENRNREAVDMALGILDILEERAELAKRGWRCCPSSANITVIEKQDGRLRYRENDYTSFDLGVWGTRGEENRIFGVKPFRFLDWLAHTLFDARWVPGFEETLPHSSKEGTVHLRVTDGGEVVTPAGVFRDTIHLIIECETQGDRSNYGYYFYENTECGVKEYWFAKGVGIVRFDCHWGEHLTSSALLTAYHTIAAQEEWMPIHIGNRWRYEEQNLTAENYIARRDYRLLSGMSGRYLMADHQMFTWKGTEEEYEAWKKTL